MISRSTIAAAAKVIEYAAARPLVLSAALMPPSKGVEAGNADGLCHPVGVDSHRITDTLEFVDTDVGAASVVVASRMTRPSAGTLKNA